MRLLCLLAVIGSVAVAAAGCGSSGTPKVATPAPSPYRGFAIHPASVAPSFTLPDQSGKPVGPRDARGHWLAVTFLYTHCPDVCPLIANNLRVAMERLPDLRTIAVSVDPKGDTPAAIRAFVARHRLPAGFRYVHGTRAQLAPVWKAYHIAAVPGPQGTISHSSYTILVDPQGRERLLYDAHLRAMDVVHDVRLLTRA